VCGRENSFVSSTLFPNLSLLSSPTSFLFSHDSTVSFLFCFEKMTDSTLGVMAKQLASYDGNAPAPWPTVDYGRNTNSADLLIIGAGISGM
jgi:hypothetical protein